MVFLTSLYLSANQDVIVSHAVGSTSFLVVTYLRSINLGLATVILLLAY
jgi:hypothetical protein